MLDLTRYREIVVLTSLGIAEGEGGCRLGESDRLRCWQDHRRVLLDAVHAAPGPAHQALAHLEANFNGKFTLLTLDTDGLHKIAGNQDLLELRGNVRRVRCTNPLCSGVLSLGSAIPEHQPACSRCQAPLMPDLYSATSIPPYVRLLLERALLTVDLFLAVGTNGDPVVQNLRRTASYAGALTASFSERYSEGFDRYFPGPPEQTLPQLLLTD